MESHLHKITVKRVLIGTTQPFHMKSLYIMTQNVKSLQKNGNPSYKSVKPF